MLTFQMHYGSLGNTANTQIPAINDGQMALRDGKITPNERYEIVAAYPLGDEILRARFSSPNVKAVAPSYILPVNNAATPGYNPQVADYRDNPVIAPKGEGILIEASNSAAGPTATYCGIWMQTQKRPVPQGMPFYLRGTSTTASVAFTWTDIEMTWDFDLPAGEYAVIGGVYYGATALAFQTVFQGQALRPGGLGAATIGIAPWKPQLEGGLGLWGMFDTITLPQIRVFNGAVVAVHEIVLKVIRLR